MQPTASIAPTASASHNTKSATPMMRQYIEIKAANPDCLLFYRMGDFYELFFEDAEIASRALGITLTKRGKHLGEDVPMCGVPVHAANDYLQKLIVRGFRVAVCEQTEDPAEARKRGSKSVVRREVTRLVTPGTLTEDTLLDAGRNNFLAAIAEIASAPAAERVAVAWIDISTGEFQVGATHLDGLSSLLAPIEPREVLIADRCKDEFQALAEQLGATVTVLPSTLFNSTRAVRRLTDAFGIATTDSFGAFSRAELAAAGAVLAYIDRTQISRRPPLSTLKRSNGGATVSIDPATRSNLELFRTLSGDRLGSLLDAIDATVTAAGARLLAQHLANPLTGIEPILARHDSVSFLVENPALRAEMRGALKRAPDLVRALSRLAVGRGGPRDLIAIHGGLVAACSIAELLSKATGVPPLLEDSQASTGGVPDTVTSELARAIVDDPPFHQREGNFVRPGYRKDLDEARSLRDESRRVIAALQARYAEETGIRSLKIKHNNVLGYFIDVTAANAEALQIANTDSRFIHRQTLASAVRFTTVELGDLEQKIISAADKALIIEQAVFDACVDRVLEVAATIRKAAAALALFDVVASHAELAVSQRLVRPTVDESLEFSISGGRHLVVEQALKREGHGFIANDCMLGPGTDQHDQFAQIWLLTGPNMAGKSTFLRQNALLAILAQMGAFVPSDSAHIGFVDAIYSRVGAADDLARGRSTFMVEMVETAAILNQAGARSLVILDEIGRGTATFDGLSIAWATIEHLHEVNRCRALFATHYHELTALAGRLERLHSATMKVREWEGDVVFLHEVAPGIADRSYGIQVAKLAGLPDSVIARARTVLDQLEAADRANPADTLVDDLPLFSLDNRAKAASPTAVDALTKAVDAIDPDALSPRAALEALYALKAMRSTEPGAKA